MKKITLVTTATLLSLACIGGQKLSADAAAANAFSVCGNGNRMIVSYIKFGNKNCIPEIKFPVNCFPGITIPDCNIPNMPEVEVPDSNVPDKPETEIPDSNVPDKPEVEVPDNSKPGITETPEEDHKLSYAEQVVKLVNEERAKEGLAPLMIDKNVQAAAQVRAVEIKTSFSHTRPNGSGFATALKEQGVTYRRAGENIAWGQRTPKEVVDAWMNSPGHRANIMNSSFTKIGVGFYQSNGVNYWSQLFIG